MSTTRMFDKTVAVFLTFLLAFTMTPWTRVELAEARSSAVPDASVYQHSDAANYTNGGKGAKKLSSDPKLSAASSGLATEEAKYGDSVTFTMTQTNVDWSGNDGDKRPSAASYAQGASNQLSPLLMSVRAGESLFNASGLSLGGEDEEQVPNIVFGAKDDVDEDQYVITIENNFPDGNIPAGITISPDGEVVADKGDLSPIDLFADISDSCSNITFDGWYKYDDEGINLIPLTDDDSYMAFELEYTPETDEDITIVAQFNFDVYRVDAMANPTSGEMGKVYVVGAPGEPQARAYADVDPDTTVTLTAVAENGYEFQGWTDADGFLLGEEETLEVEALVPYMQVFANFDHPTLIVSASVAAGQETMGTAKVLVKDGDTWTDMDEMADLPEKGGQPALYYGTIVKFAASPSGGCAFDKWVVNGDPDQTDASAETDEIEVTSDLDYVAYFALDTVSVSAAVKDNVGGAITQFKNTDTSEDLSGTAQVQHGSHILLSAEAEDAYLFDCWEGLPTSQGLDPSSDTVEFEADGDYAVLAVFRPDMKTVKAEVVDPGTGSVLIESGGLSDPAELSVQKGQMVTITASPATGYSFKQWSNIPEGLDRTNPVISFVVEESTPVIYARFQLNINVDLSWRSDVAGVDGGTASYDKQGEEVHYGENVVFTAEPAEGFHFKCWEDGSGGQLGTGLSYTAYAIEDLVIVAVFEHNVGVEVSADPEVGGSVSKTEVIVPGADCTVTATPNEGYEFDGWYEGGAKVSDSASYTFPARDVSLIAKFVPTVYTVTFDLATEQISNPGGEYTLPAWGSGMQAAHGTQPLDVTTESLTVPGAGSFVCNDYVFAGWSETPGGALAISPNSAETYTFDVSGKPVSYKAQNRTYYAKWDPKDKKSATFDTRGGSAVPSQEVIEGHSITMPMPSDTAAEGYYLMGWSDMPNNTVKYAPGEEVQLDDSATFYAVWVADAANSFVMSMEIPSSPQAFFDVQLTTAKLEVSTNGGASYSTLAAWSSNGSSSAPEIGVFSYASNVLSFAFTQSYLANTMPYTGETYRLTVVANSTKDGSLLKSVLNGDSAWFPQQKAYTDYDDQRLTSNSVQVREKLPVMDIQKSVSFGTSSTGADTLDVNLMDYVMFTLTVRNTVSPTIAHDVAVVDSIPASLASQGVQIVNDSSFPITATKNGAQPLSFDNPVVSPQELRFKFDDVDLTSTDSIEIHYWMRVGDSTAVNFKQLLDSQFHNTAAVDATDDNGYSYTPQAAPSASATLKVLEAVPSLGASATPETILGTGGNRTSQVTANLTFSGSPNGTSVIEPVVSVSIDDSRGAEITGTIKMESPVGVVVASAVTDGRSVYTLEPSGNFNKGDNFVITYTVQAPNSTASNMAGIRTVVQATATNSSTAPSTTVNIGVKLPYGEAATVLSTSLPSADDTVHVTHTLTQREAGASMNNPTVTLYDVTSKGGMEVSASSISKFMNLHVTKQGTAVPYTTVLSQDTQMVIELGEDLSNQPVTITYDDYIANSADANLTDTSVSVEFSSVNSTNIAVSTPVHYIVQEPVVTLSKKLLSPLDEEGNPAAVNVGDPLSYEVTVIQSPSTARSNDFEFIDTVAVYDGDGNEIPMTSWPSAMPYFMKDVKITEGGKDITDQFSVAYSDAKSPGSTSASKPTMMTITGNFAGANPTALTGARELKITYTVAAGDSSSRVLKGQLIGNVAEFEAQNMPGSVRAIAPKTTVADAALGITKKASSSSVKRGETMPYEILVTNKSEGSASLAKDVTVTDNLDEATYKLGYRIDANTVKVSVDNLDITNQTKVTWGKNNSFTIDTKYDLAKGEKLKVTYTATTADIPSGSYSNSLMNMAFSRSDNAAMVAASEYVDYDGQEYTPPSPGNLPGGGGWTPSVYPGGGENGKTGNIGNNDNDNGNRHVVREAGDIQKTGDVTLYIIIGVAIVALAGAGIVFFIRRRK